VYGAVADWITERYKGSRKSGRNAEEIKHESGSEEYRYKTRRSRIYSYLHH